MASYPFGSWVEHEGLTVQRVRRSEKSLRDYRSDESWTTEIVTKEVQQVRLESCRVRTDLERCELQRSAVRTTGIRGQDALRKNSGAADVLIEERNHEF